MEAPTLGDAANGMEMPALKLQRIQPTCAILLAVSTPPSQDAIPGKTQTPSDDINTMLGSWTNVNALRLKVEIWNLLSVLVKHI